MIRQDVINIILLYCTVEKNGGQPVFFPVYQWITQMDAEPLIVMTNSTTLPQKDSTNRQVARRLTLQKLPWTEMTEGLPLAGYYEMANYNLFDLDYNMELDGVKISNITRTVLSDVARGAFQKAKGLLEPIKSFDDYFDVSINQIKIKSGSMSFYNNSLQ
jgi:hypothetical protein